ncbi:MAG: hypothetical protein ACTSRK_02495 [Promethearchaeota archaeon]
MKPKYSDILSRITDEPIWFGNNGVPRYESFNPSLSSDYYSDEVILLKIQCQNCRKPFLVEMHNSKSSRFPSLEYQVIHHKSYLLNSVHYGDPPRHNYPRNDDQKQHNPGYNDLRNDECVGTTMNAESLQIVEFWKRENLEWVRKLEYEIAFTPLSDTDVDDFIFDHNRQNHPSMNSK